MHGIDGIHEVVLYLHRHLHLGCLHVLGKELDTVLNALIFVDECLAPVVHHLLESLHVLLRQCEHHLGLIWDGIAHISSVPCGKASLTLGNGLAHEAHHEFVGIGASYIDFKS